MSVEVKASTKQLCDAICKLEFCSRLLFELAPNEEGVWTTNAGLPRVNAQILGFPPSLRWSRDDECTLTGTAATSIPPDEVNDLEIALEGLVGTKKSIFSNTEYIFFIKHFDEQRVYDYSFSSRARSLVAFCILWDLQDHPRDHLELLRDPSIPYLEEFPYASAGAAPIKTYGDPSKTIDELRNQGFPRDSDQSPSGSRLEITRLKKYGTSQEHYRLLSRVQSVSDRVGRSQIPRKFKQILYKKFGNCCNNCGERYDDDYLAPDHRVPSIVQADNLTQQNYLDVLQALCVRCNQVKREACKKCPYNHNCAVCAWAYPEKMGVSPLSLKTLRTAADRDRISINELISKTFRTD